MANIKQQKKRNLTNEKQRLINASFKASLRTAMKDVEKFAKANDKENAVKALAVAFKKLDKAVSQGFLHKNNAARHKSSLQKLVNSL